MLKGVRVAAPARCEACCINKPGCIQPQTSYRTKGFQAFSHKRIQGLRSKPKPVQPDYFLGSIVGSASVTTQSVTEAVRQATFDRPLLHHALHSVASSLAWFGVVWVITRYIGRKSKEFEAPEEAAPSFLSDAAPSTPRIKRPFYVHAGQALLVGANLPIAVFAPMAAVVYSLRSVAWFLSVALASQANQQSFSTPLVNFMMKAMKALKLVDTTVLNFRKLGVIVFICWTLLRFKECLVKTIMDESIQEINPTATGGQGRALERVMLPVSGLASWVVVCAGSIMCLAVLGINVQPLLTVGGVSTVLVGLSAQSVLANLISGINLFLSRPFVVGDRVELSSGGGERVLVGVIERVDPMRTIVRTDASLPVTIPNKVLSEMIISNESNILTSRVLSHFNRSRQLLFTIKLRYKDLEKVEIVVDEMRRSLNRRTGVDRRLPTFVGMSGFQDYAINIVVLDLTVAKAQKKVCYCCGIKRNTMQVHTTPVASRDWGNFRQRLLMDFGRIINKHAVQFAYPTQVTHMPHLEEAILQTVQSNNGADPYTEAGASARGNGAGRPPSPQTRPPSPSQQSASAAVRAAQLEIEHSTDGGPPKASTVPGLAGSAAEAFGNEANKSTDVL